MKKFFTLMALCLGLLANAAITTWPYATDIVYSYMEGKVYTIQCGYFPKGVSTSNRTPLGVTTLSYVVKDGDCTTANYVYWYQRIGDTWEYLPRTSKPNPQANMFRAVNVYDRIPKDSPGAYDRYSACASLYNIQMKRDKYFRADVASITFTGYPGQVLTKDITISYSSLQKDLSPAIVVESNNAKTNYDTKPVYDGSTTGTPLHLGSVTVRVTGTVPAQNGTGYVKFWDGSRTTLLNIPVNYVVENRPQTVTWSSSQTRELSVGESIQLNASASTSIQYSIVSGSEYARLSGKTLTGVLPGKVTVRATASQANGYQSAYADIVIEVKAVRPPFFWGHLSGGETYYVGDIVPVGGAYVMADVQNPITYAVVKGEDKGYFVEPQQLLGIAAGVVTVRATVAAGNGYTEASLEHDYEFFRRQQSINTELSGITIEAGDSIELDFAASSGLPVSYNISAGNECVYLRNDSLFAIAAGNATLQIAQAGDQQYEPAETVEIGVTIVPKTATGTQQAQATLQIWQEGNLLHINADRKIAFRLYNITGQVIAEDCAAQYSIRLDTGVYLLYYQNEVRKIVVR